MSGERSLFAALTAQRRFVYLIVALLSIGGIWAGLRLPSAIYPELQFSRVTIVTQGGALGARQTMFSVTRPIEEAVSVVPGVTRVQSRSIRGGSETNVTFGPRVDMTVALQQVQARVNQVRGDLPSGLDIQIERLMPSLFPILSYNLEGGDPATLYDVAQYQIRPLLSRVPGVARVEVMSSLQREVEVIADPVLLAAHQLTYDSLAAIIRQATTPYAVGRMPSNYRQYLIVTATEAQSADDIAAIVVAPGIRVRDIATVVPSTEDRTRVIAGDGKPAASITVSRQIGGNSLTIADSIASISRSLQLPPGVHLKPLYDQALLVREAVRSVRDAMLVGAALAVIILLLFLQHGRITAISASSIPLTLTITVLVMSLVGQSFNLMTLGAMAIAIGLVIDDAVVVTENIVRHLQLESNASRTDAIHHAVQELIWPVTTSTITTVVVFLPLGLLTGVEGQFFHALSITLTIAVLVSLFLALTLIPLLASQFLVDSDTSEHKPGVVSRLFGWLSRGVDALAAWYGRRLSTALRHPMVAIVGAIVLVAGGVAAYRFVGTGFLPEMDEGAFVLDYFTPGGTALDETDRIVHIAENILASTPEVEGTSRRTGAELGLFATQVNSGDIVVRLKPQSQRDRSADEVIDDVRPKINAAAPRLHIEFVQILSDVVNDLAGNPQPVEIKVFGPDLDALESYARKLAPKLAKVDGVEDLYNGVSEPSAEMTMAIDAGKATQAGLTVSDVSGQVSSALLGADAGDVRLEDRSIGVRVRAPDSVRFDPLRLSALPIVAGKNRAPLGAFATFTAGETRGELLRENQQQLINITADISGRSLGGIMRDVKAVLKDNPAPSGFRVEVAGQYASQQQAFRALLAVLALAALSVVAIMVLQFRSFIEPLVILLAAPLSFVGALILLLITGTPLNVASFMGLILLVGLIVKNGIILLDFTHRRLREGASLPDALEEAGKIRLRPILMTTLCTLFGLLPLALALGAGSQLQQPLALAVIGGLALSTPITLFIVPTLLVAIRGRDYREAPQQPATSG
ncbi:MAG TPA: efflux RND transporter permease subunit [Gemmatimonadales bacterium]